MSIPRQARPPEPVPDLRHAESEAEALDAFRKSVSAAAGVFTVDRAEGQRMAIEAAIGLVWDLTDDPLARAPFIAVAKRLHAREPNADSIELWQLKAAIAAYLDVAMSLGMREQQAAKELVELLRQLGINLRPNRPEKITWRTIAELRTSYLAGRADPKAVKTFDYKRGELTRNILALDMPDIEAKAAFAEIISRDLTKLWEELLSTKEK